ESVSRCGRLTPRWILGLMTSKILVKDSPTVTTSLELSESKNCRMDPSQLITNSSTLYTGSSFIVGSRTSADPVCIGWWVSESKPSTPAPQESGNLFLHSDSQ